MVNENEIESFLNKIKNDEAFAEKVLNTEDPEKVIDLAKNAGIILSLDDLMITRDAFAKTISNTDPGELSDKDLENVAGGLALTTAAVITGCVVGVVAALAGGAVTGGFAIFNAIRENNGWKW